MPIKKSIKGIVLSIMGILLLSLPLILNSYPISRVYAQVNLDFVNQRVCDRFEEDVARLAAIMEELRRRKGITETRVAFGGYDSQIKVADYWITYAAEAIAFQRVQKSSSKTQLKSSLEVLKGKVLRAKNEAGKAIN